MRMMRKEMHDARKRGGRRLCPRKDQNPEFMDTPLVSISVKKNPNLVAYIICASISSSLNRPSSGAAVLACTSIEENQACDGDVEFYQRTQETDDILAIPNLLDGGAIT